MAASALYPLSGIETNKGYFSLSIDRAYSWGSSRIGITPVALKLARQNSKIIFGLERSGVRFENVLMKLPSLFIRTAGKGTSSIFTVLLSPEELSGLGEWFGFKPDKSDVLNRAFFEANERRLIIRPSFSVRPIWSELLDPAWKDKFLAWISKQGRMPSPSEIKWETSLRGFLTFPALLNQVSFSPSRKARVTGKLVLKEENGLIRACFCYDDKFSVYKLSSDNAEFLENGKMNGDDDTYSKNLFLELLGLKPKRETYDFSRTLKRTTSKQVFYLGNMWGEQKLIYANNQCGLEVGKVYYFRIIREGQWLKIQCFKDAKSDRAVCFANVLLTNGEMFNSVVLNRTD
jgi:hypothetical protein